MGVHYKCIYCGNSYHHTSIQRENHILLKHTGYITSKMGYQIKSRFARSSSISLQKEYTRITRRFASENQLNLLSSLKNVYAYVHNQIKIEIKLLTCWAQGEDGHVEKLWYSLNIFPWRSGEAGINNFLFRAFRDYFLPNLEDSHPRNASGMSFLGVEIVDVIVHKIPSLRFGCGENKLPSFIDPKHVISP